MERLRLSYKTSAISYIRLGSGTHQVFCFHGYGENASYFSFLEKHAGDGYSFFAIDLPFHGLTEWNEDLNCTIHDIQQIVEKILQKDNDLQFTGSLPGKQVEKQFSLLGFSLGGRIVLSLYEQVPERIAKLILLAPDGLTLNFWYWLSTQTWMGNRLFVFTMKHPQWFFLFLKILNRLRFVNASIFKFVSYYIDDQSARTLLYRRWTVLRKLKPHLNHIKSLVAEKETPVRLVYGKHDRIILPKRGERFIKGIEKHCKLMVIASGHQVLHEKHAKEIIQALLH